MYVCIYIYIYTYICIYIYIYISALAFSLTCDKVRTPSRRIRHSRARRGVEGGGNPCFLIWLLIST